MDCLKNPSNYFFEHNGAKCLKLKTYLWELTLSKKKKKRLGAYIFSCIYDSQEIIISESYRLGYSFLEEIKALIPTPIEKKEKHIMRIFCDFPI